MTRALVKNAMLSLLMASGIALVATTAEAETSVCRGEALEIGATLRGPVLHVVDGERMCVALGATPDRWVEIQVQPAPLQQTSTATPSRGNLMAAAFAQNAVCTVTGLVDGRAVARCDVEGQPLAERLGQPAIAKVGQTWR